jgi:preprotein translocase subunit SecE
MGRLIRKKTTSKKKKTKGITSGNSTSDALAAKDGKGKSAVVPKRAAQSATPVSKKKTKNYLDIALQFLREVKVELKKVTWPSRKQTIGSTAVVIVLVIIVAFILGTMDIGLSSLMQMVLH